MRAPICLLALLFSAVGCEPMDNPGSLFEPVHVASQAAPAPAPAELAPALDPLFPTQEPVVIHSSEMGKPSVEPPSAPATADEEAPAPVDEETPVSAGAPAPAAAPAVTAGPAVASLVSPLASSAWPLRLVATVPGAQPPRAILGLPGGSEVVVTPGTMLPAANVVVMAVGASSVELAEVHAVGDHAVVQPRTLLTLAP